MKSEATVTSQENVKWIKLEFDRKTVFPNTNTKDQTPMSDLTEAEKQAIDVLYRGMCKREGIVVKDDDGEVLDTDAKISAELVKVMEPEPEPEEEPDPKDL